jgi:deoxyribose-phosphate aldolase
MNAKQILSHVDHTLLKPTATWEAVAALCEEAIRYGTATVCIPASFVERAHKHFGNRLRICTVVGFPLGYDTTQSKAFQAWEAIQKGAEEIDMVVNLGWVKDGHFYKVTQEIRRVKEACGDKILKVIIETCYLTKGEKIALCACVGQGGAQYIKTSTGFGSGGATVEDIQLLKRHIAPYPGVKMKASGGVRTREDMETYLRLGVDRLGASGAVAVLKDEVE